MRTADETRAATPPWAALRALLWGITALAVRGLEASLLLDVFSPGNGSRGGAVAPAVLPWLWPLAIAFALIGIFHAVVAHRRRQGGCCLGLAWIVILIAGLCGPFVYVEF